MNFTAILTAVAGVVVAVFGLLFKHEKSKRVKAEEQAEELKTEVETVKIESEGVKLAKEQEKETSEFESFVNEKTEQAIKEIHEATIENQAKIYNEKVKGWKQVKR